METSKRWASFLRIVKFRSRCLYVIGTLRSFGGLPRNEVTVEGIGGTSGMGSVRPGALKSRFRNALASPRAGSPPDGFRKRGSSGIPVSP
jgi:hypothetical protein